MADQIKSEWDGTWLTDADYIVTIKDNKIVSAMCGRGIVKFVNTYFDSIEGMTYYGLLMHKRRGEEDLRTKWKTK